MRIGSSKFIKFVLQCQRQAESLPEYSSKFSRKDYTLRQHVVLLCLKIKTKQRYREFCEILDVMTKIKALLGLDKTPHWTTLDKIFLKLKNSVLAALLQVESSGFASIDATTFDRSHLSLRYQLTCKRHIEGIKTTFLIDHDQNIIDLHCTTRRRHDSQIVLPLTRKHRLRILCADRGYDDNKVRGTLRARGVRPIIPYREFKNKRKVYWNSLIDMKIYHKRSFCETVNSVIKRKYSDTLYSKNWRSQFKELTLLAIVYNLDRKTRVLLEVFYEAINFFFRSFSF